MTNIDKVRPPNYHLIDGCSTCDWCYIISGYDMELERWRCKLYEFRNSPEFTCDSWKEHL